MIYGHPVVIWYNLAIGISHLMLFSDSSPEAYLAYYRIEIGFRIN